VHGCCIEDGGNGPSNPVACKIVTKIKGNFLNGNSSLKLGNQLAAFFINQDAN
jgi:hypothetical protein